MQTMAERANFLTTILRHKAREVSVRASAVSLRDVAARGESAPTPRDFLGALELRLNAGNTAVIAELKRASPSKGRLREDYQPAAIAASYEHAGAAALSILTDSRFFQGEDEHLLQARSACSLPCLRKDFIIDEYQVYEARALGADCILLIVAALGDAQLSELAGLATHLGMGVLVEVHDAEELERALQLPCLLVGINNRNLRTFETRLETTLELKARMPDDRIAVAESGILTAHDVARVKASGVRAFLVGEAFMRSGDPGARLSELFQT
jgi:indole-3-glycerol phosphate synthase